MHNIKILVFNFIFFCKMPAAVINCGNYFSGLAWSLLCCMNTLGILIGRKAISRMSMTWKGLCPLLRKMNPIIFSSVVIEYCLCVFLLNHVVPTRVQSAVKPESDLFSYLDSSFREFYKKITYDRLKFCILPL